MCRGPALVRSAVLVMSPDCTHWPPTWKLDVETNFTIPFIYSTGLHQYVLLRDDSKDADCDLLLKLNLEFKLNNVTDDNWSLPCTTSIWLNRFLSRAAQHIMTHSIMLLSIATTTVHIEKKTQT